MSREHRRPLTAFVVLALACGLFMGYSWRAQAQELLTVIREGTTATQQVVASRYTLRTPVNARQDAGGTTPAEAAPNSGQGPVLPDDLREAVRKVKATSERQQKRQAQPAVTRTKRHNNSAARSSEKRASRERTSRTRWSKATSRAHQPRARRTTGPSSLQKQVRRAIRRHVREARSHRNHAHHDRSHRGHAYGRHAKPDRSHRGHAYGRYAKRDRSDRGFHHRSRRDHRSHRSHRSYGHRSHRHR